jgi:peptide subunit release factor RF-3
LGKVNPEVDIYNSEEKEILLFNDGIQVKGQKDKRQPKAKLEQQLKEQNSLKSKTSAVITDIVLLQKATREFEYIAAPIDEVGQEPIGLTSVVKASVMQEYGDETFAASWVGQKQPSTPA